MGQILQYWWIIFIACFTVLLVATLWMNRLAKHFILDKDGARSFSIFDLEFPATENQLHKLLYLSTPNARRKLKMHLWVDFLFMPAAYIGIALLCYKTAMKMEFVGRYVFLCLASAQALSWLFDIIENSYLLNKLASLNKPVDKEADSTGFKIFENLVRAKFAIALTGAVCAVFGLFYFWLMGAFQKNSLPYIAIIVAEIILFLWISRSKGKKEPALT